jgi:hypothetical protein
VPVGRHRSRRRGRALAAAGVPAERPRVIAMTDARTYRAHLVTDAAVAAGRADMGCYHAVYGVVVLAASMTTPETSFCGTCARRHGGQGMAHIVSGSGTR